MKLPKNVSSVIFIAGIAAVIGSGITFLALNSKTIKQPQYQSIPPVSIDSKTANWKTFTNSVNNYTIKIPTDWEIDNNTGAFLGIPGEVIFIPPSQKEVKAYQTNIAITAMKTEKVRYSLNTAEKYQEWISKPISDGAGERLYKVGDLEINGTQAVQFVTRALPGDPTEAFYSITTWLRKDGTNYYIELGGSENIVKEEQDTYNQILQTFKFLD